MPRKKKSKEEELREFAQEVKDIGLVKKKKKKKASVHRREFGIEIIHNGYDEHPIKYQVGIDLGFRTAGLTLLDMDTHKLECLYYKKQKDCQVQGMKIVDLINLCKSTIEDYIDLLPDNVIEDLSQTRFILEEPLVITGQRSFSISLYVLLSQLIEYLICELDVHSVVLIRPGSAKKLLGWSTREHMPDGEKTKFIKENLPDIGCKNNHQSDSTFGVILTNQELLKEYYPALKILNKVEYKIYDSKLEIE